MGDHGEEEVAVRFLRALAMVALLASGLVAGEGEGTAPTGWVVMEVFTSHGCINCPPSDAALQALSEAREELDPGVVPLEYHVPFFDRDEFQDRFAQVVWGRRMRRYMQLQGIRDGFTPWAVLNGVTGQEAYTRTEGLAEVLGRRRLPDVARLEASARWVPGTSATAEVPAKPGALEVRAAIELPEALESAGRPVLDVVVLEHGLETEVRAGDNRGKAIENGFVVRARRNLCWVVNMARLNQPSATRVEVDPSWRPENLELALLLQERSRMQILQARRLPIAR